MSYNVFLGREDDQPELFPEPHHEAAAAFIKSVLEHKDEIDAMYEVMQKVLGDEPESAPRPKASPDTSKKKRVAKTRRHAA